MTEEWYDVVSERSLEQGDILFQLPVGRVEGDPSAGKIRVREGDFVILSQTCDLEYSKISEVLLASVISYETVTRNNNAARQSKYRDALIQGLSPQSGLLRPHEGTPYLDWSIIDFHHLYLIDKTTCEEFVNKCGQRLRLRSPYKEHLAQSYARYMMRVGLPMPADDFANFTPWKNLPST